MHRRREQRRFAQRNRRKRQRQPPRREHPPLHRLDQLRHRPMAVVIVRPGIDDPHHRPVQHGVGIAHRLGEGFSQIEREIGIAIIGGVATKSGLGRCVLGHAGMLGAGGAAGQLARCPPNPSQHRFFPAIPQKPRRVARHPLAASFDPVSRRADRDNFLFIGPISELIPIPSNENHRWQSAGRTVTRPTIETLFLVAKHAYP